MARTSGSLNKTKMIKKLKKCANPKCFIETSNRFYCGLICARIMKEPIYFKKQKTNND